MPSHDQSAADPEDTYRSLLPVFFSLLRRLARQGHVIDAGQGMDLIHDFYLVAWPRVMARFDPAKGSLASYAATAFVRFARPRLVREARWRETLSPDPTAGISSAVDAPDALDVRKVHAALEHLDAGDSELLRERFDDAAISERALACRHHLTRYRYRERLAQALARLTVALGEPGRMDPSEFEIARRLFGENQSVHAVAAALRLSASEVRTVRRRILAALGHASVEST